MRKLVICFYYLINILLELVNLQPAVAQPADSSFTLEDMETVRVVGKGSGGVVQLVRHKWTGQFFALKVNDFT